MRHYTGATVSGYRRTGEVPEPQRATPLHVRPRLVRPRWALGVFSYVVSIGLVAAFLVEPSGLSSAATQAATSDPVDARGVDPQSVTVDVEAVAFARDGFDVVKPKPKRVVGVAPAVGVPDPGSAQAIAYDMVMARGWGQSEFDCLVALWNKESGWNVYAHNKSSGAYGIPQSLPGDKMATAGADWATNPVTQITWGLGYISGRYGTPCGAWGHSQLKNWY